MSDHDGRDSGEDANDEDGFDWQPSHSSADGPSDEETSEESTDSSSEDREEFEDPEHYERARKLSTDKTGDSSTTSDTASERVSDLEDQIAQLEQENADLKQTIDEVRDELDAVEEERADLETTVNSQQGRIDDLEAESAKIRQALSNEREEFKNYKERAKKREEQAKDAAVADIVEDMAEVRDSLQRALEQDETADIRSGVESTLTNFDTVLAEHDIELIDPDPGAKTDAARHEVMMKDSYEDVDEGRIASVFSVGYERGDRVLKPAQVVVSSGDES